MTQYKDTQVVMLPTEDNSRLFIRDSTLEYAYTGGLLGYDPPKWLTQHLYGLSDEPIKEGDWFIADSLYLLKCGGNCSDSYINNNYSRSKCKKIIWTTDSSLLNCNGVKREGESCILNNNCKYPNCKLPQPSQDFIKHFIEQYKKDNIITSVLTEYVNTHSVLFPEYELKINPDNTVNIKFPVEEKLYTIDEVRNIANWAFGFYRRNDLSDSELEEEFNRILTKQFKKK